MYLVIAEKPSVSQSIAKVIGAYKKENGYLEGKECIVSWCLGHLAEYMGPATFALSVCINQIETSLSKEERSIICMTEM